MINNIQLLRAFAAVCVVFYHENYCFIPNLHGGNQGVPIFFVISGFIMAYISRGDTRHYMIDRVIRIVPLFWFMTVVALLHSHETPIDTIFDFSFIPHKRSGDYLMPVLGLGWTLRLEMYFYVVLSAFLAVNKRFAPIMTAVFLIAMHQIVSHFFPSPLMNLYYGSAQIYDFCYGIGFFYIWRFLKDRSPPISIPSFLLYLWIAAVFAVYATTTKYHWQNFGSRPPILVLGALIMAAMNGDVKSSILTKIGDASYCIYLTHQEFMDLAKFMFNIDVSTNLTAAIGFIVFSVSAGLVIHYLVERPVHIILKKWMGPKQIIIR